MDNTPLVRNVFESDFVGSRRMEKTIMNEVVRYGMRICKYMRITRMDEAKELMHNREV